MPKRKAGHVRRAGYREAVHVLAYPSWGQTREELVAHLYGMSLIKLTADIQNHKKQQELR